MDKDNTILHEIEYIASQFQLEGIVISHKPILIGHIHQTYQVATQYNGKIIHYIVQKINTRVFTQPQKIMHNILTVADHLAHSEYPKKVLRPIPVSGGNKYLLEYDSEYWRAFPFYNNTVSFNLVENTSIAYEVAYTLGEYVKYLDDLPISKLYETIPNFHNTPFRYESLMNIIKSSPPHRIAQAENILEDIERVKPLLAYYKLLSNNIRVVHYDTKINNVLLDIDTHKGISVIDLDTLMPGMLSYDFGDMVRTMTPPVDENHPDISLVKVRKNILEALTEGFLEGLDNAISPEEKQSLFHGAGLIIYEQAIRFITDYLEGDVYYPTDYENQNLVRGMNQMKLLDDFLKIAIPDSINW